MAKLSTTKRATQHRVNRINSVINLILAIIAFVVLAFAVYTFLTSDVFRLLVDSYTF